MRYFIYENDAIVEVSEDVYQAWDGLERGLLLPDLARHIEGDSYYLESMFIGAMDETEWDAPAPFVLLYFEDKFEIGSEGISKSENEDDWFYFDSYIEYEKKYYELIEKIEEIEKQSHGNEN